MIIYQIGFLVLGFSWKIMMERSFGGEAPVHLPSAALNSLENCFAGVLPRLLSLLLRFEPSLAMVSFHFHEFTVIFNWFELIIMVDVNTFFNQNFEKKSCTQLRTPPASGLLDLLAFIIETLRECWSDCKSWLA